jgi:phosphoribosylglycinamide formyltransferase-1
VTQPRVAVLASGEGTNVQALLDDADVGPWIALVASDRAAAGALERARRAGVEAIHVDPREHASRDAFDVTLLRHLRDRGIDVVALAGFMRLLGADVVRAYEGRILNVHPALLPSFPGTSSVADALAWGV